MAVAGDGNRILRRFLTDALVDALQGTASMGNRPRRGGADGEGMEHPFPCLLHLNQTLRFHARQATPTTRPLRGLLPPPSQGAGSEG